MDYNDMIYTSNLNMSLAVESEVRSNCNNLEYCKLLNDKGYYDSELDIICQEIDFDIENNLQICPPCYMCNCDVC